MKTYDLVLLGADGFIGSHFYSRYKKKISIFKVGKKNWRFKKKKCMEKNT